MQNSLIKINFASPDEIAKLHGVGAVLANRIYAFRESNGFFRAPDDLAMVEGISPDFALMLGTQIDWQVPITVNSKKERDWELTFLFGGYTLMFLWVLITQIIPSVLNYIGYYRVGFYEVWVWIWISVSLSFAFIFETARGISITVIQATTNKLLASKMEKMNFFLFGMFLLSAISSGLGHATYYQFYSEQGWNTLWNNPYYMAGLLGVVNVSIIMVPRILVFYNGKLASSIVLRKLYDIGVTIAAPIQAWSIWLGRNDDPIWISAIQSLFGLLFLSAGYQTLRYGKSFFSNATQFFSTDAPLDETSFWIKWLNVRLPDPEQQKALKQALEKTYPNSKIRTITGAIVFGAGGWVLITVLTSLIDWFIQNWLDKFIR